MNGKEHEYFSLSLRDRLLDSEIDVLLRSVRAVIAEDDPPMVKYIDTGYAKTKCEAGSIFAYPEKLSAIKPFVSAA